MPADRHALAVHGNRLGSTATGGGRAVVVRSSAASSWPCHPCVHARARAANGVRSRCCPGTRPPPPSLAGKGEGAGGGTGPMHAAQPFAGSMLCAVSDEFLRARCPLVQGREGRKGPAALRGCDAAAVQTWRGRLRGAMASGCPDLVSAKRENGRLAPGNGTRGSDSRRYLSARARAARRDKKAPQRWRPRHRPRTGVRCGRCGCGCVGAWVVHVRLEHSIYPGAAVGPASRPPECTYMLRARRPMGPPAAQAAGVTVRRARKGGPRARLIDGACRSRAAWPAWPSLPRQEMPPPTASSPSALTLRWARLCPDLGHCAVAQRAHRGNWGRTRAACMHTEDMLRSTCHRQVTWHKQERRPLLARWLAGAACIRAGPAGNTAWR